MTRWDDKGNGYNSEERAKIYELLALGFGPPATDLAKKLNEVEALRSWFDQGTRISPTNLEELVPEYHRLFVMPGSPVPPYESIYREGWRVMGESTVDVVRQYEKAGFYLSPSFKDLPDHIAAELEFMALLCEEEETAWHKDDFFQAAKLLSREETFLKDHLVRWIPHFSSRILSSTDSAFYRALASLLGDHVLIDLDCVRGLRRLLKAEEFATRVKEETRDEA